MLFTEASLILQIVGERKGSIKSLVQKSKCPRKKPLFALVCETLKYSNVLNNIIHTTKINICEKELKGKPHLISVLVYDFLFGKKLHDAPKSLRNCILRHKSALRSALALAKVKAKVVRNVDLMNESAKECITLPRYGRVNAIKITMEDALQTLKVQGYQYHAVKDTYQSFLDAVKMIKKFEVIQDFHIPELLIFHPNTDFHENELYLNGSLILQDKASCIPAFVLSPVSCCDVIDACAAPGNKTSHAAAIMSNKGRITAFDLDPRRCMTMDKMLKRAGATCIRTQNKDFLSVDPAAVEYQNVKYFIVDPSCSGSGIVNRLGHLIDDEESSSPDRLTSLAEFQVNILLHALSFPAAERVVYSTCSIHQTENEDVVNTVYSQVMDKFELDLVIPTLPGRGSVKAFPEAEKCLRLDPKRDLTNGFFVACFKKRNYLVESSTSDKKLIDMEDQLRKTLNVKPHCDENFKLKSVKASKKLRKNNRKSKKRKSPITS